MVCQSDRTNISQEWGGVGTSTVDHNEFSGTPVSPTWESPSAEMLLFMPVYLEGRQEAGLGSGYYERRKTVLTGTVLLTLLHI